MYSSPMIFIFIFSALKLEWSLLSFLCIFPIFSNSSTNWKALLVSVCLPACLYASMERKATGRSHPNAHTNMPFLGIFQTIAFINLIFQKQKSSSRQIKREQNLNGPSTARVDCLSHCYWTWQALSSHFNNLQAAASQPARCRLHEGRKEDWHVLGLSATVFPAELVL